MWEKVSTKKTMQGHTAGKKLAGYNFCVLCTVLCLFILLTYFCDSPWWLKQVGISLGVFSVCNFSAFNCVTFSIVAEMLCFTAYLPKLQITHLLQLSFYVVLKRRWFFFNLRGWHTHYRQKIITVDQLLTQANPLTSKLELFPLVMFITFWIGIVLVYFKGV